MPQFSDIHFTILWLLAECGCVSKSLFSLLNYNYHYLTRILKTLHDTNTIRKYGKGQKKYYTLTPAGRKLLTAYNPLRFSLDVLELNKQLSGHPDRAVLRGDVAAILSLVGYSVHFDDKPLFPAITPLPQSPDYQSDISLCRNTVQHTYPDVVDMRQYTKRLTAIGSYYDATVVKGLLPKNSDKDNEGVNYSRLWGDDDA